MNETPYKVGDIVMVIDPHVEEEDGTAFNNEMRESVGKKFAISREYKTYRAHQCYRLEGSPWCWLHEWLVPVEPNITEDDFRTALT